MDLSAGGVSEWTLCSDEAPYRFRFFVAEKGQSLQLPVPAVVQVLGNLVASGELGAGPGSLRVGHQSFEAGETFNLTDHAEEVRVESSTGPFAFVVASPAVIDRAANDRGPGEGSAKTRRCDAELVTKPWGEERWLHPEGFGLALKALMIRAGGRTSLQFHRQKHECMLIASGRLRLHHCVEDRDMRDLEAQQDATFDLKTELTSSEIIAPAAIEIVPGTLHRLEALDDLCLIEISTLDLEDVVRIQDDHGRPDGRIASEHRSKDEAYAG